eukprot:8547799-Lingulodinium_polyedra.AAC.1
MGACVSEAERLWKAYVGAQQSPQASTSFWQSLLRRSVCNLPVNRLLFAHLQAGGWGKPSQALMDL